MTTNPQVPGLFPVALDGHSFLVDMSPDGGGFISASVPMLGPYFSDQGARPGEQSLNKDGLWRRSVESWHKGAGQTHADRDNSDQYRFRASLHLNPWNKFALSLLPVTGLTPDTETAGVATLCVAGDKLYYCDGSDVFYTDTMVDSGELTFAAVTGMPSGSGGMSITSDGARVYVVVGGTTDDVYVVNQTTGVATSYVANGTTTLNLIRFAKDRLLVFGANGDVYDVSTGALGTALFTHRLGNLWTWTDATDGLGFIYMSGYTGTGSEAHGVVYRVGILADGTGLDVPIIAARLPDGEQALAVKGYLGVVFVGTSLGARTCLERTDGALQVGDLIATGPCQCFEPQASQVWFGWTGSAELLLNGGLGRIDLTEYDFAKGAPPYASDLAAMDTDTIAQSVVTFKDRRVFATNSGVFTERTVTHNQGTLLSGLFSFDLTSPKSFHYLHVKGDNNTEMAVNIYVDDNDARGATMGLARTNLDITDAQPDGTPSQEAAIFDLTGWRADQLEYKLDMYTTINRVTLMARPAISTRSEQVNVTLLVADSVDVGGQDVAVNVADEVQHIRSLTRSGAQVDFQDGAETYKVIVEDYKYVRTAGGDTGSGKWQGAIQVQMKRFDTVTPVFRSLRSEVVTASTELTVAVPDGVLPGDVFFAAVAWAGTGDVPLVTSPWAELGSSVDTNFGSATYKLVGGSAPLVVTFVGPVDAVGVVLAYTQGDDLAYVFTVHDADPSTFLVVNNYVTDAVAAVTATVAYQPSTALRVGAARSRARVVVGDVVLDVGDALSTSTFDPEPDGFYPPGVIDALSGVIPIPSGGEVRVWVDKLTA